MEDKGCICEEIADMLGFRLTDEQIKRVCDLHTSVRDQMDQGRRVAE